MAEVRRLVPVGHRERRVVRMTAEVRAVDDGNGRTLEGHAAVFNSWSEDLGWWEEFREIIRPGAFRQAIERSDIRCLFNHDPNLILGRKRAGTLEVWEDTKGLAFRCPLPDTQLGRDLCVSLDRGDIDQCSFAFTVADGGDRWWREDGVTYREILEFEELYDVSPVTYPAYVETDASVRAELRKLGIVDGTVIPLPRAAVLAGGSLEEGERLLAGGRLPHVRELVPEGIDPADGKPAGAGGPGDQAASGRSLALRRRELELL